MRRNVLGSGTAWSSIVMASFQVAHVITKAMLFNPAFYFFIALSTANLSSINVRLWTPLLD